MYSPIVSVIIPVYNISTYLPGCLNSLIHQTLSEIEILCIDDASTDDSVQIIKSFQEQDSRVRLLQQPHRGVSEARNLGISHARGKYISFVDGDDWIENDMLATMLAKIEETESDMVICSTKVHFEQQSIRSLRRHNSVQAALTVEEHIWNTDGTVDGIWNVAKHAGSWPFIWNKLIRSDLIKENAICFSPALPLGEDGVFLQLLFQYAKKIVFVPKALYHYRYQRKSSATENLFQHEIIRFQKHIDVAAVMLREFHERKLFDKNRMQLLQWLLSFFYADFIHLPAVNRQEAAGMLQNLFAQYGLATGADCLSPMEQKRLKNMLEATKGCTEAKRLFDIVQTKVENRMRRIFAGK